MNTCPMCERQWEPSRRDDVYVPCCGCYDDRDEWHQPCEECGLTHVRECNPTFIWIGPPAEEETEYVN